MTTMSAPYEITQMIIPGKVSLILNQLCHEEVQFIFAHQLCQHYNLHLHQEDHGENYAVLICAIRVSFVPAFFFLCMQQNLGAGTCMRSRFVVTLIKLFVEHDDMPCDSRFHPDNHCQFLGEAEQPAARHLDALPGESVDCTGPAHSRYHHHCGGFVPHLRHLHKLQVSTCYKSHQCSCGFIAQQLTGTELELLQWFLSRFRIFFRAVQISKAHM
ncbi:unnamed protein product [Amoebophrya sp. A120]|nr:unnamed protein product [Amoebophrya sp. A120]|eukprot:GSA120T00017097001.1